MDASTILIVEEMVQDRSLNLNGNCHALVAERCDGLQMLATIRHAFTIQSGVNAGKKTSKRKILDDLNNSDNLMIVSRLFTDKQMLIAR
jgi:hypothetical protein